MSTMDWKEVEAASVEEATREALEQLGAREDEVTIEVIATPRAGVLGLGARNARVRVTRKGAAAAGNVASTQASSPAPQAASSQARREGAPDGSGRGRENQGRGRNDGRARNSSPAASAGDDDGGDAGRKSMGVEEQRREAIVILKQILEQM